MRATALRRGSAFADYVHALGGYETEGPGGKRWIALPGAEGDRRLLPQRIDHLHLGQARCVEPQACRCKTILRGSFRGQREPVEAILAAGFADGVLTVQLGRADQRRQRAVLLFAALRATR